ncbi:MAG: hypothetical protein ACJ75J_15040 [Cytophagaceae bacterium]
MQQVILKTKPKTYNLILQVARELGTETDFFNLIRKVIAAVEKSIHPDKLSKIRIHYTEDLKLILTH